MSASTPLPRRHPLRASVASATILVLGLLLLLAAASTTACQPPGGKPETPSGGTTAPKKAVVPLTAEETANVSLIAFAHSRTGEEADTRWGFVDTKGRLVLPLAYQNVYGFHEGLAAIRVKGKWGYIDEKGTTVIKPTYFDTRGFCDGLAVVQKAESDQLVGFIDKTGKMAIPAKFDKSKTNGFTEGLALASLPKGKLGFIDKTGAWAIKPTYSRARPFSQGLAAFKDDSGKWGFIDKTGQIAIAAKYADAGSFTDGLARVQPDKDGKWGYIDNTGRMVIKPIFTNAWAFNQGLARVKVKDEDMGLWAFGFIDKAGAIVIPTQTYQERDPLQLETAANSLPRSSAIGGYVDGMGRRVVDGESSRAGMYGDGMANLTSYDEFGYMTRDGKWIVKPQRGWGENPYGGYAAYVTKKGMGVMETATGKMLIEPGSLPRKAKAAQP